MANLTIIQTSPDPEQVDAQARNRRSVAARIRALGQNRIGAVLLLLATFLVFERRSAGLNRRHHTTP